ncbi:hypothetical protein [Vibrio chaetopteri]|uniref:Uncharacterized protein n=1 Tax=Vibrio chaetopteri TaxID=3016528 RepID=A0AAU8BTB5_9VIBR
MGTGKLSFRDIILIMLSLLILLLFYFLLVTADERLNSSMTAMQEQAWAWQDLMEQVEQTSAGESLPVDAINYQGYKSGNNIFALDVQGRTVLTHAELRNLEPSTVSVRYPITDAHPIIAADKLEQHVAICVNEQSSRNCVIGWWAAQ